MDTAEGESEAMRKVQKSSVESSEAAARSEEERLVALAVRNKATGAETGGEAGDCGTESGDCGDGESSTTLQTGEEEGALPVIGDRMAEAMKTYPFTKGNPLIDASDEEIRAFIRERRKVFDEKYAGMNSAQIAAAQLAEADRKAKEAESVRRSNAKR